MCAVIAVVPSRSHFFDAFLQQNDAIWNPSRVQDDRQ